MTRTIAEARGAAIAVLAITFMLPIMTLLLAMPIILGPVPLDYGVRLFIPLGGLAIWSAFRIRPAIDALRTPLAVAHSSARFHAVPG